MTSKATKKKKDRIWSKDFGKRKTKLKKKLIPLVERDINH